MLEKTTSVENEEVLERTVTHFRKRGILLPTFAQQRDPRLVPAGVRERLRRIGLWELDPLNLFRITWKNEPVERGGGFGGVNYLEMPRAITGVAARILVLVGKWFPTGAHKVGAAYGCLVPRLVTGAFDPTYHQAVWPSTGNYCRGGAFDSYLMGCRALAILPEGMSRERFEWLREAGAEIIATHGCESNVKEIYDKCWEIRATRPEAVILNQFDEFGNGAWHYAVTGAAVEELFEQATAGSPGGRRARLAAFVSATGSAGTIAAGDYLKSRYPALKVVAAEALQCPTLLQGGFGGHRIEGIGDKHVPWIHNVRSTDVVAAIDDEECLALLRLFNEPAGAAFLAELVKEPDLAGRLPLIGISGIANLLASIKTARYFELDGDDVIVTLATDSAALYRSRLEELAAQRGEYDARRAELDYTACIAAQRCDNLLELTYPERKRIHNLKYYTWVEQQHKEVEDLNRLWEDREIFTELFTQTERWDEMIDEFNRRTGLAELLR